MAQNVWSNAGRWDERSAEGNRGSDIVQDLEQSMQHHQRAAFHHETASFHHRQAAEQERSGRPRASTPHAEAAGFHGRAAAAHGERARRGMGRLAGQGDRDSSDVSERSDSTRADGRMQGGGRDQYDSSERGGYRI